MWVGSLLCIVCVGSIIIKKTSGFCIAAESPQDSVIDHSEDEATVFGSIIIMCVGGKLAIIVSHKYLH